MIDYLLQVFEGRLVEMLENSRYDELGSEDVPRILRSVEQSLQAPSLVQGARELLFHLDDQPEPADLMRLGDEAAEEGSAT